MEFKAFIGIDVSKKTFDVALKRPTGEPSHTCYANDAKGISSFLRYLKKEGVAIKECLSCMEHTGVYTCLLLKHLDAKGANIWLEQALNIKRSLGIQRGKNDKVDSLRIAGYAHRFKDKAVLWGPAREEVDRLKNLVSLRERLIKAKKALEAPVGEMMSAKAGGAGYVKSLTLPVTERIKQQLAAVEQQIEELIADDGHISRLQEVITSVDGVGKVTAWQMITTTNEFKDFDCARKFACYSGVVPFDHSSGTSIYSRPRVSQMANKRMKELLHMSALSATVMKGELNDYYRRKTGEGKNKMLVLNNIRNKIVQRVFACVNANRKYEKNYMCALA